MSLQRIAQFWDLLKSSYWFLPITMCVVGGVVFYLSGQPQFMNEQPMQMAGSLNPNDARSLIAAIVASSITVVSLTFSITIVALTLASSQFGTRLVYSFMRDTSTQVVLGMFSATFIFSLLTLASLVRFESDMTDPVLRIQICIVLGLSNVFFLIYFLHHIASSIQATAIVHSLSAELSTLIISYFPDKQSEVESSDAPSDNKRLAIVASHSGVLQSIDVNRLTQLACENALLLDVACRPGDYLYAGQHLAYVLECEELADDLNESLVAGFLFGERRTLVQDLEYGFTQLVEIAVRALSPGINDPNTAVLCINALAENLVLILGRQFPGNVIRDSHHDIRIYLNVTDFDGVMCKAFDEIRQHGANTVAVKIALLSSLKALHEHARSKAHKQVITHHFDACFHQPASSPVSEIDQANIEQLHQQLTR